MSFFSYRDLGEPDTGIESAIGSQPQADDVLISGRDAAVPGPDEILLSPIGLELPLT